MHESRPSENRGAAVLMASCIINLCMSPIGGHSDFKLADEQQRSIADILRLYELTKR